MIRCRTAELGGHVQRCDACGHQRIQYNSCRNRHCPKCQAMARAAWLEKRESELLPVPYFHVVFTLPHELAPLALQNQRVVYGILFQAAAQTLLELAADPEHLGARVGCLMVLHTWGQNLMHHPHVHAIVTGGGLSPDGSRWIHGKRSKRRQPFFAPVKVLSRVFRGKFIRLVEAGFRIRKARLSRSTPAAQRSGRLRAALESRSPSRLGRVRETSFLFPGLRAEVSGPLYPRRRHLQPAAGRSARRTSELSVQGLRSGSKQDHDLGDPGIHPPLLAAHASQRFRADPLLRLPGESPAAPATRALPPIVGRESRPANRRPIRLLQRKHGPCRSHALPANAESWSSSNVLLPRAGCDRAARTCSPPQPRP